ncbi:MAG: ATP-dependent DNA helicase DinG [Pseudohongiellaceae bacterium]
MLADDVKNSIQSAYKQLIDTKELTPRYGQRLMIAEIAKNLANIEAGGEPPVCVVEAGTGTGKTLAYVLAVLPLAQKLGYKVVIATATVALQEQVVLKDLPEIIADSGLKFSFSLAKGRGRYLCMAKLDMLLEGNDSLNAMMDLYGEVLDDAETGNIALYESMLTELSAGRWQGDKDDWATPLPNETWKPLTADTGQCMGPKCSHFRNCCFYQARDSMDSADCIVANHDLVLTDLALGGGAILPEPEKCIYVFDEAHHLPIKSNNHFSTFTKIRSTITWIERCEPILDRLVNDGFLDSQGGENSGRLLVQLRDSLEVVWLQLEQTLALVDKSDSYENRIQHAFELGKVPEEIRQVSEQLAHLFSRFSQSFHSVTDALKDDMEEGADLKRRQLAEQWFPLVGSISRRAESNFELWHSYAVVDSADGAPRARWLSFNDREGVSDIGLSSSPVLAAENLQEKLWRSCAAAVLTSATLSALGEFSVLKMRAGLPEHTHYVAIPSPFDFQNAATLEIPKINCEPSNSVKHTEIIIKAIPQLVDRKAASLMLFSSRRQMNDVIQGLSADWRDLILCQDDYQKSELIKFHRSRIDKGEGSFIFGLSSFAEGVDLPGKYCTHVLIAKIPFSVPNDPIEMTLSAWVELQGSNPFITLAVPDAAFKLVQASGRLLRNESDTGKITIFDERLISKRYGKQILDSLPPYRQEIYQRSIG